MSTALLVVTWGRASKRYLLQSIGQDWAPAAALDGLVRATGSPEALEYWKSAPYLLNFMKGYAFKQRFDEQVAKGVDLSEPLSAMAPFLLDGEKIEQYQSVDPANARMRALLDRTLNRDEWRMLWLPPSLAYVESPHLESSDPITKSLVFSSWNVVPDVIAAVCSYTAERKRVLSRGDEVSYTGLYRAREALLEFSRAEGRPKAMSNLLLLYPSPSLSRLIDPLRLALDAGRPLSGQEVVEVTFEKVRRFSRRLPGSRRAQSDREDKSWYWASLARFDARQHADLGQWIQDHEGWRSIHTGERSGEAASGFDDHVDQFLAAADGDVTLGKVPEDLDAVLQELALGSPAVCASRALRRVAPKLNRDSFELMSAAARIAEGFSSLFNSPDIRSMIELPDVPYWRAVLRYCRDHDLQSVLDEYVHTLKESLGLIDAAEATVVEEIASAIQSVLSIRVSALDMDEIDPSNPVKSSKFKVRCRYALRFADLKGEAEQVLYRAGVVREAFNSPFRPFILASTSIGQEGLDFHSYCHRIWHWNLPQNPVDLEQREGRVNRYKGHAIRKNVARAVGLTGLREGWRGRDPWEGLFWLAKRDLKIQGKYQTDITPYWIYEDVEEPFRVERLVPLPPFSSEHARFKALKKSLAVYRLALGQPRQEDLLSFLTENSDEEALEAIQELQIDLSPR